MKKENMIGFRVSLYYCNDWHEFWKDIKPTNCISSAWIAQTIGDQIWMWFEFANKEDKKQFLKELKAKKMKVLGPRWPNDKEDTYHDPIKWLMHKEKWLTQKEIDHWTK